MRNSAFTLVELAIVIVIIGLLVGGVIQGQELIKQAEVRTLIKTFESYKSAATSFEGKYNCMPGDCIKAYDLFGTVCDATPSNCNGNGDRTIQNNYGNGNDNEAIRFWQHLSLSNFIKGTYRGAGSQNDISGTINPRTNFKDTFIFTSTADSSLPSGMIGKGYFMAGRLLGSHFQAPFMEPADAFAFDSKIDDGRPYTGVVGTYEINWSNTNMPNCSNSSNDYKISYSGVGCHIAYGW